MLEVDVKKLLQGANGSMQLRADFKIKKGEFVALFGKSGSGKTTLFRIIAGLESAKGRVVVDSKVWQDERSFLKPWQREIGFVFQDYALFENMSVLQNLLYVAKDKDLAFRLLEFSSLLELKDRLPSTLSGGQKQRVALCRALMKRPKLLLLDEPLSALDTKTRLKLQNEILKLHYEFETTTILVSHEPSEIYNLCSRVLEIENGKIVADCTPKELFLKSSGSQKFSFEARVLEIAKVDVIYVAIVSIGQQICEVVVTSQEAKELKVGDRVKVSTKAFSPIIEKIE